MAMFMPLTRAPWSMSFGTHVAGNESTFAGIECPSADTVVRLLRHGGLLLFG